MARPRPFIRRRLPRPAPHRRSNRRLPPLWSHPRPFRCRRRRLLRLPGRKPPLVPSGPARRLSPAPVRAGPPREVQSRWRSGPWVGSQAGRETRTVTPTSISRRPAPPAHARSGAHGARSSLVARCGSCRPARSRRCRQPPRPWRYPASAALTTAPPRTGGPAPHGSPDQPAILHASPRRFPAEHSSAWCPLEARPRPPTRPRRGSTRCHRACGRCDHHQRHAGRSRSRPARRPSPRPAASSPAATPGPACQCAHLGGGGGSHRPQRGTPCRRPRC